VAVPAVELLLGTIPGAHFTWEGRACPTFHRQPSGQEEIAISPSVTVQGVAEFLGVSLAIKCLCRTPFSDRIVKQGCFSVFLHYFKSFAFSFCHKWWLGSKGFRLN
jgi:hypothetical protein